MDVLSQQRHPLSGLDNLVFSVEISGLKDKAGEGTLQQDLLLLCLLYLALNKWIVCPEMVGSFSFCSRSSPQLLRKSWFLCAPVVLIVRLFFFFCDALKNMFECDISYLVPRVSSESEAEKKLTQDFIFLYRVRNRGILPGTSSGDDAITQAGVPLYNSYPKHTHCPRRSVSGAVYHKHGQTVFIAGFPLPRATLRHTSWRGVVVLLYDISVSHQSRINRTNRPSKGQTTTTLKKKITFLQDEGKPQKRRRQKLSRSCHAKPIDY